jgi:diaminopropionate ammonia-lyase
MNADEVSWFAGPRPAPGGGGHPLSPGPAAAFHASLPGYAVTPLSSAAPLAAELGVGRVLVKDESGRFGVGSFKALGASWAVRQVLAGQTAAEDAAGGGDTLAWLRDEAARRPGLVFVTATDGNHGRALAWMARQVRAAARVFVPSVTNPEVIAAIEGEDAAVIQVAGSFDDAVAAAGRWAGGHPGAELVQDTTLPGYREVPGWIVAGYSTLFGELGAQLAAAEPGASGCPALVVVPVGVGSLAQAAVMAYHGTSTAVLAVEPETAACLLASLRAGAPVTVPTGSTIMAGLNCGSVSEAAWPWLVRGITAAVAVSDGDAARAAAALAAVGVSAGPSGAASLAGARAALTGQGSAGRRRQLGVDREATVVLLNTEAAHPPPRSP